MKSHHYFTELSDCGKAQSGLGWLCPHLPHLPPPLGSFSSVPEPSSFLCIVRKVLLCVLKDQTGPNPNILPLSNSEPFSSPVQVRAPGPSCGSATGQGCDRVCLFCSLLSTHCPPSPTLSLGRSWWGAETGEKGKGDTSFDLGYCLPFSCALFPCFCICLASFFRDIPLWNVPRAWWSSRWPGIAGFQSLSLDCAAHLSLQSSGRAPGCWAVWSPGKMGLTSVLRVVGASLFLPWLWARAKFRTTGLFLSQLGIWTLLLESVVLIYGYKPQNFGKILWIRNIFNVQLAYFQI